MARFNSILELKNTWPIILIFAATFSSISPEASAITASVGQPYRGSLQNGIPFPSQFQGYTLREADRTHTTPEVIGAMLDAIEAVQQEFPGTCDLYLGDFSNPRGGPMTRHRSHQNGRDVDLGLYAKGNRPLTSFIPMNAENLDVPKTWALVENLLQSQRVQYIFIDRSIQKLWQDYALSQGADPVYLERLFARNGIIRHIPNHADHIHVRFYAPWSTMAARLNDSDDHKRKVVEMAQQAYLPKRVNYYVKGSERNLQALARSFGVTTRDLCRWNDVSTHEILSPGTCLVFYKRGFEIEPVHLAQSLRPDSVPEVPATRFAALRPARTLSDAPVSVRAPVERGRKAQEPKAAGYTVRRGDTLYSIARANGMDVKALNELNGWKGRTHLRAGQRIKVMRSLPDSTSLSASNPPSQAALASAKVTSQSPKSHKVSSGDTLYGISKKYGLTVKELCEINALGGKPNLRPGQELVVSKQQPPAKADVPSGKSAGTAGVKSTGNANKAKAAPASTPSKTSISKSSTSSTKTSGAAARPSKTKAQSSSSKVEKTAAKPAARSTAPKSAVKSEPGAKSTKTGQNAPSQGKTSSKTVKTAKNKS